MRWTLLEAGLAYESVGNSVEVFGSDELRGVHPLGKLPAAIIDAKPLFESAAIVTAVADLVPEKNLIARPGSWSRNLHYQWVCFALTEMEPYVHSTEINSTDFVLPEPQHVPAIIEQNSMMYKRAAAVLEAVLGRTDYLIEDRFSATDIIVGYTISSGQEQGLLGEFSESARLSGAPAPKGALHTRAALTESRGTRRISRDPLRQVFMPPPRRMSRRLGGW